MKAMKRQTGGRKAQRHGGTKARRVKRKPQRDDAAAGAADGSRLSAGRQELQRLYLEKNPLPFRICDGNLTCLQKTRSGDMPDLDRFGHWGQATREIAIKVLEAGYRLAIPCPSSIVAQASCLVAYELHDWVPELTIGYDELFSVLIVGNVTADIHKVLGHAVSA